MAGESRGDALIGSWVPEALRVSPLFAQALTHRSAAGPNYERLEFLGDSILGFVIAEALYQRQPQASEGELTRLRSTLVKQATLASIARERHLSDYFRLGKGELKSGGFDRESILADVVEALIGAHYLILGMEATYDFVLQLFGNRLDKLPNADALKDPKTRLQERMQASGLPLPEYELLEMIGAAHQQTFRVACCIRTPYLCMEATGSSRRKAEQAGARQLLEILNADQVAHDG